MVLATDMALHFEKLGKLKTRMSSIGCAAAPRLPDGLGAPPPPPNSAPIPRQPRATLSPRPLHPLATPPRR